MFVVLFGLFASQMTNFLQEVLNTADLSQCTGYSPLKNPNMFSLDIVPQFQTNELTLYVPDSWWEKRTGEVPVFKDKNTIFSSELNRCFVITNGGKDDFFDTLSNIGRKAAEWKFVKCNKGLQQDFYGFLHKNGKTFVGLGPYSALSSFLPRADLFVGCARGKLFLESLQIQKLPCNVESIRSLIRICSQKEENKEKLASAIGISQAELLNLNQSGHDQLSGTTMTKVYTWFRNISVNEISEEFGVSPLVLMNLVSLYSLEKTDTPDDASDSSSVSQETASDVGIGLAYAYEFDDHAQKVRAIKSS